MEDQLIGVIADTHGLLRPQALRVLRDCSLIIHAGDIGNPGILMSLEETAPVVAVRGNIDTAQWAKILPEHKRVTVDGAVLYVIHDLKRLALDPAAEKISAVISGHSHKPALHYREGVLLLNPGSAGPRRFNLPVCVARLDVKNGKIEPEIVELELEQ